MNGSLQSRSLKLLLLAQSSTLNLGILNISRLTAQELEPYLKFIFFNIGVKK